MISVWIYTLASVVIVSLIALIGIFFLAITDESDVDEIYCRTCFWALGDHTDDATEG